MDPQNLMSTLQQLSNLSGTNLTSQMALNQFGNDLSSMPWASGQAWLDSAKMAAMYNIIQTASVNDQVQQLNTINAMNSFEQSLKMLTQQTTNAALPQSQSNIDQLTTAQSNLQTRLAMESIFQNDTFSALFQNNLQQQHQVSTPSTSLNDTTTTSLAHLLQNTSNAEFLANNLQNTMSSILGLTTKTPSSNTTSALPTSTEQELFNVAANHLNNLHDQINPSQNPFETPVKKSSKEHHRKSNSTQPQPSTSHSVTQNVDESLNQAQLLSRISQSHLLSSNPTNEQSYLPTTSANNPFIQQNSSNTINANNANHTAIDDFDLGDLNELLFDKNHPNSKEQTNEAPNKIQVQNTKVHDMELDHHLDHFASMANGEFDFDEKNEHAEKLFDSLKFLKEIGGGADRDSLEPGFNQAELEPVQFTPPDSPQHHHHQTKLESLISPSTSTFSAFSNKTLQRSIRDLPRHIEQHSMYKQPKVESKVSTHMPLVFIPPVQSSTQPKKSINAPNKNSSLLQRSNKVPIYKQKYVNLTSGVPEQKGEDCYSFVDDDFDLPMSTPKPSTSTLQKEKESTNSTITTRSTDKSDKIPANITNASVSAARRLAKLKEHKEPRHFGTPWFSEFLSRQALEPRWTSINPFECTELYVDKTSSELEWTADRSTAFKKNSLRLVIKEEPVIAESSTEEAPRPRLVLKFFKPKNEEIANQELPEHNEDKHSKKHKKHKRKHKDDDYEYPGEVKKHKKDKKHKHHHTHKRHRVKPETIDCDDDEDSQPAFNTRSALSVKTENSDSPTHSSHSFASSSNHIQHNHKQSSDLSCLIGGRLVDEQFTKRLNSFAQTQSDLPKGIFVVAKDELWKEECPLWRIDSQNLLQKFVLCDENPGCYTNTSNYTGWCDEIAENYIIIHVQFLKQTRAETIIKPLYSLDTLFPALPTEDSSIVCGDDNEEVELDSSESELTEMIGSVVELLLKQCSDPNTLQETYKSPESKSAQALQRFQNHCLGCIEEIQIEEMIRLDLCMLLDTYNTLITFENQQDDDENECLGCGSRDELLRIGLHSGEKYDPNLLTIQRDTDEDTFCNAMDFPVCKKCSDQIQFYHKNRHALFHIFKACENQFIDLALEKPSSTSNALLNLSLKDKTFIDNISNGFVKLWSKLTILLKDVELLQFNQQDQL